MRKGAEGLRAGDAVRIESPLALEAHQRSPGARVEETVDRAGREAVPDEPELERGHVPPDQTGPQLALAEQRASELSEGSPGLRPHLPRRPDALLHLQADHSCFRQWAGNAVDGPAVQPVGAKTDLERSDTCARSERRSGHEQSHENDAEERRSAHARVFALGSPIPRGTGQAERLDALEYARWKYTIGTSSG